MEEKKKKHNKKKCKKKKNDNTTLFSLSFQNPNLSSKALISFFNPTGPYITGLVTLCLQQSFHLIDLLLPIHYPELEKSCVVFQHGHLSMFFPPGTNGSPVGCPYPPESHHIGCISGSCQEGTETGVSVPEKREYLGPCDSTETC